MLLPLVGKNDILRHFWGAKAYFRRPFWPAECAFVLFLKNFSQCQGDAGGIGKTLREILGEY